MKKSQLDTEIDENLEIFQFSKFYAVFLENFHQTPEIGMLKRVKKEQMLSRMLSETINAAFQKKCLELTSKRKNFKIFYFHHFSSIIAKLSIDFVNQNVKTPKQ